MIGKITYNYSCSFTEQLDTHRQNFHHMRYFLETIRHPSTFLLCRSLLSQIPVLIATAFNRSRRLVEANVVEAADRQQREYGGSEGKQLCTGQHVLLSNPSCGKLDPQWTGPWTVTELKGPTNVTIKMVTSERIVHTNRLRPLLEPSSEPPRVSAD